MALVEELWWCKEVQWRAKVLGSKIFAHYTIGVPSIGAQGPGPPSFLKICRRALSVS